MANYDELKRLGERFPNKNVGCGNPDAKIGSPVNSCVYPYIIDSL